MTRLVINRAKNVWEAGERPQTARYLRRLMAPTQAELEQLQAELAPYGATVTTDGDWLIVAMRPKPRARLLTWEKLSHRHWTASARGIEYRIVGKGNHYRAIRIIKTHEVLLGVRPTFTAAAELALSDLLT